MSELSELQCEACHSNSVLLTTDEIESRLPDVPGWEVVTESGINKLSRSFKTGNYANTMLFTNAVAELAESMDHHPLLVVEYSSVTVIWWSHKIKGLHLNDFIMAAKTTARWKELDSQAQD